MTHKFPKFSKALADDPTTRRLWFALATAHDFESHDGMTEEKLYQKIFASHFGQLAIIFLWTAGNLFHVAWQGNFEQWCQDPLHMQFGIHILGKQLLKLIPVVEHQDQLTFVFQEFTNSGTQLECDQTWNY